MTTPVISLIASAARPENWQMVYDSIGDNDVEFELVFVGPKPPICDLPENFVFIESNVKPAQCWEIAARRASGELLMWVTDDIVFTTEAPLDTLYRLYRESGNKRAIISTAMHEAEGWNRFFQSDMESPLVPLSGLMSAELWHEVGGIDRRFIALTWEMDIALCAIALGGEIVETDVYIDVDIVLPGDPNSRGTILYDEQRSYDRALLDSFWSVGGKMLPKRSSPVESFENENILTRSQHPQGRWRHKNDKLNRVTSFVTRYKLRQWRAATIGKIYHFVHRHSPSRIQTLLNKMWGGRTERRA